MNNSNRRTSHVARPTSMLELSSIKLILTVFVGMALLGQGCFAPKKAVSPTGPDMGIWKSSDRGQTWVHKKALINGPTLTADAANFGVQAIEMDPQDRQAVYLGTIENGLVYTYDGGDSWQRSAALEATDVRDVAIDSKNKCTVYAVSANKIYKTETCGRDWETAFFDPRTDKIFTQVVVDWFNPTIIYAGTDAGDIFKSTDEGVSWQVVKRANANITHLVINPQDSRVIYAGTYGDGIWKSLDAGITWTQIRKEFGDIGDARRVLKIVPHPADASRFYLVHKDGIAMTPDNGATWEALTLVTDIGENKVTDLAIDNNDPSKMVYTGPTALVFTQDAGKTWEVKKLPTANHGSVVLIDPADGNNVYLGILPAKRTR
ncbi:MAG: VPS10 domain-containing protein [Patescibacteria group bacterium]